MYDIYAVKQGSNIVAAFANEEDADAVSADINGTSVTPIVVFTSVDEYNGNITLRLSGLAKLTAQEKAALGLGSI